ncbi:MAG: redox-regulated ATPase YchF [Sphingomonadales bacterium]
MGFACGIVGLPNVGKSTLFNALTKTAAAASENYPFCTIEPNTGRVPVPDERLHKIGELAGSAKIIETQLTFVDIAGLVRGASKGEGLGNQFLGNIREVEAIIHVLRCFEDTDITHVENKISPVDDAETVEIELMLSDLESLEKRRDNLLKKSRGNDKEAIATLAIVEAIIPLLEEGKPARLYKPKDADARKIVRRLQLLTTKPVLYVANVEEDAAPTGNSFSEVVQKMAQEKGAETVVISAAVEAEIAQLDEAEQLDFLEAIGLKETGLAKVIRTGQTLLDQITFFTVGPKEARAWTVRNGAKAPRAAGVIHTDFEKGFIRAETTSYPDFVACGGEQGSKDAGKMRLEGKEYIVKDGDIMLFRFAN